MCKFERTPKSILTKEKGEIAAEGYHIGGDIGTQDREHPAEGAQKDKSSRAA